MKPQNTQAIVAIVVTHNRLEKLKTTVKSLLKSSANSLERLIICNNASTDGTSTWLASLSDTRLDVMNLTANIGGAGGFEASLRHAAATSSADWFVVMDDDARPEPAALERFTQAARNDADVWLSAVRYPNGSICEMNRPWHNPFGSLPIFLRSILRGREAFHLPTEAYDSPNIHQIDGGSFVGQFISRKALTMAGYPRGDLFIYADDVLFTLAVRKAGGKVAFDPSLRFEHDCETLTANSKVLSPIWKVYFYHRNIILVYRQLAGPLLFWPVLALKYPQWYATASHYGPERKKYLRLLKAAISDALKGHTGTRHNAIETIKTLNQ